MSSSPPITTYLTAVEVAATLRVTPKVVVTMCRNGELKAYRPNKQWLITEADLAAYIERSSNTPEAS